MPLLSPLSIFGEKTVTKAKILITWDFSLEHLRLIPTAFHLSQSLKA
jgi:hypothetical protein